MKQLNAHETRRGCPKCGYNTCICWKNGKQSELAGLLNWENDICPGCGRTKKACQTANGSGCTLR